MELLPHRGHAISGNPLHSYLQECFKAKNLAAGRHAHAAMVSASLDSEPMLANSLIQLYASCGSLAEVNSVFCRISKPSPYTWDAIISAHVKFGAPTRALALYHEMSKQGSITPNRYLFLCVLKACCNMELFEQGMQVHMHIIQFGMDWNVIISTALVNMYAKCGRLEDAHKVFVQALHSDAVLWGALISGYVQQGQDHMALELFANMQDKGHIPDHFIYSCILKACGNVIALRQGMEIHAKVITHTLEWDKVMGSTLVDMYVTCGTLEEARKVFDSLPDRDNVLWSSMIAGYAQHGHGVPALELFIRAQKESTRPDKVMYTSALKACASIGDPTHGRLLQEHIIRIGLDQDEAIGNALVQMYFNWRSLKDAQKVFEGMRWRSVMSWNAMISAYADLGYPHLSIELFKKMQQEGVSIDNISVTNTLKACSTACTLEEGRFIHNYVMKTSIESRPMVGNTLVDMYAKCGSLDEACAVFDKIANKDLVSWNAIIAGSAQYEHALFALVLFAGMQDTGPKPDRVTFTSLLKACSNVGAVKEGFFVHFQIIEHRLELDVVVGSALIDMYCKGGLVEDACKLFDSLPNKNLVTWNSMIAGYAQQWLGLAALECYEKMCAQDIIPNDVTFLSALKACGMLGAAVEGRLIHCQIIASGHDLNGTVANTLVDMYAKCGSMQEAHRIFDALIHKDIVSWNAMIAGCARPEHGRKAFDLFYKMQQECIQPDEVTYACTVKACSILSLIKEGQAFHLDIVKLGLESNPIISSALLDLYATDGLLEEAQKILQKSPSADLVSCNELVAGYVNSGNILPALKFFDDMEGDGLQPDNITYSSIMRACSNREALEQGRMIHDRMTKSGDALDEVAGSTIVNMYVKCGSLTEARQVFDGWPNRDIVMWSAMIGGYVLHDHCLPALELFSSFLQEGLQPDAVIFSFVLKASCRIGAAGQGMVLHDQIMRSGLDYDAIVRSSLIDMYGKLGSLEEASKVFRGSQDHNLESWSAMIAGYAQQGNCEWAQKYMESMQQQGWKPDEKTYASILAGCGHAAKVDEAHQHFQSMKKDHGVEPGIQHFNCLVDLLGRSGRLDEAQRILQTVPPTKSFAGWVSLLSACKQFGDSRLGRHCFKQLAQLNPDGATGHALVSNMYADFCMQNNTCQVHALKNYANPCEKPETLCIEVKNKRFESFSGIKHTSEDLEKERLASKYLGPMPMLTREVFDTFPL